MKMLRIVCAALLFLAANTGSDAAGLRELLPSLTQGGYVLVFRHVATDDSQKDVYPFNFDDMKAQRQLSDPGREMARRIGAAIGKLGIPIGDVYTSRLNRAVETGKLLFGKDVKPVDALTDSSAGVASGMANPSGGNARAGRALRELVAQGRPEHRAGDPQDQHHRRLRQGGERRAGGRGVRLQVQHRGARGLRRARQGRGLDCAGRRLRSRRRLHRVRVAFSAVECRRARRGSAETRSTTGRAASFR